MELTKLQRHTAYIIMLEQIESLSEEFICHVMKWEMEFKYGESDIKDFFPELFAKKPKNAGYSWFDGSIESGRKKRIELLNQCIAETF